MQILAKNLSKNFGNKLAVKQVNLEILPGKILGLLGPNGAGKSTTIKMLTGQLKPDGGGVIVDSVEYPAFPLARRSELGIMPQDLIIWEDLSIRENLQFAASLYKLSSEFTKERIDFLVASLKLEPEIKTLGKNLSGGYKRRLNLALSIIHDPKVFFLDEPTPGIDAQSRILLTDFIQKLAASGNYAIVLTDHYLEEAEKLADYVVIIDNGQIVTEGTVSELKQRHGPGNLLQVHLSTTQKKSQELIVKDFEKVFGEIKIKDNVINILVKNATADLNTALTLIKEKDIQIDNLNLKEPSLEDIFLLLTGKEVRE